MHKALGWSPVLKGRRTRPSEHFPSVLDLCSHQNTMQNPTCAMDFSCSCHVTPVASFPSAAGLSEDQDSPLLSFRKREQKRIPQTEWHSWPNAQEFNSLLKVGEMEAQPQAWPSQQI